MYMPEIDSIQTFGSTSDNPKSEIQNLKWLVAGALLVALTFPLHAAQKELPKLTVGFTPISGAAIPFFIAVEERLFQKHGIEVSPVFMGGSPLINSAILAGEFPIGYTAGGAVLSSRLSGSDLLVVSTPLPVLAIDGWARPEIKSVGEPLAALLGGRVDVSMIGYPAGLNAKNAGFKLLFRPSQTDYGLFPTAAV